jgi:hypothetical protein
MGLNRRLERRLEVVFLTALDGPQGRASLRRASSILNLCPRPRKTKYKGHV